MDAMGIVLAGGRSTRMGTDKATLAFNGRPLIANALEILHEADLPLAIAGSRPDLKSFAPTIDDLGSSRGPLGGICGALQVTSVTTTIFLPVDMPLLPSSLIRMMQEVAHVTGHDLVVPSVNGFAQTFPALINRAALPALKAELEAGRGGCFSAFQATAKALGQQVHVVRTELLVQTGRLRHPYGLPPTRWFSNINSVVDLQRVQAFGLTTSR
jgi:molybdenum cofactor guanylyltransferase